MATVEVTKHNLQELMSRGGVLILDWWATWCAPCRAFLPIFQASSERHRDILFGTVNAEADPQLTAMFQVKAVPTVMVFRDGVLLFDRAGLLPEAAMEELIKKVRGLDMASVRRELARQAELKGTGGKGPPRAAPPHPPAPRLAVKPPPPIYTREPDDEITKIDLSKFPDPDDEDVNKLD